jgi:heme/copper-type cytochrome/quinol oxidase subunit 4
MWEVLRWMIVFVLALLLIVVAIYLVLGEPLPIPQF